MCIYITYIHMYIICIYLYTCTNSNKKKRKNKNVHKCILHSFILKTATYVKETVNHYYS